MARNLLNRLWQSSLQLNLYKKSSSDIHTAPKEYLATRLCICSLTIIVLIISITSALLVRTVKKIEYSPSYTRFSRLASKYPDTIYCPCSSGGIAYDTFVTTDVIFHQVCSSQFIEQTWIDMAFAEQNNLSLALGDFRTTLSFFWQVIAGFCNISTRTWADIEAGFKASHTVNPEAVTEEMIYIQAQATLNNTIYSARTELSRKLLAIRRIMSGNQIVSAFATNFYLRYPPGDFSSTSSLKMSPTVFNNCSCLHSEGCPHPAMYNDSHGNLITIPGMIADCFIMDGTLASTLECYYNQTCLSLLHQFPSIIIQPLSNTLNKHFMMNSTIEMLLNEIMIDKITVETRFDLFYSQCNPAYCSYSYTHRFDALFVITTIIGIFSGLSFALRLIAPFIAKMILRWKNRGIPRNNMLDGILSQQRRCKLEFRISASLINFIVLSYRIVKQKLSSIGIMRPLENLLAKVFAILNHLRLLPNYIRQTIINFNLFESQRPRTPTIIFREQLLTRLFLLFFVISSIATGFYTLLLVQNQVVTIAHPSLTTYQQLYHDYSDTLQCPCSQLSVAYGTFLNVTFVLHQVCSSDFVSSRWLHYLESYDPILLPEWAVEDATRDFRVAGGSYFQLLATFCSLTKSNIEDAQHLFTNTQFINDHVLAPSLFLQQTDSIIKSYATNTKNDFQYILDWIIITFTGNYFLTGTNTNSDIIIGNNDTLVIKKSIYEKVIQISHAVIGVIDGCACPVEFSSCFAVDLLYTVGTELLQYEQIFSELPIGCIPLTGFLISRFTWWYKETYLENIQDSYARVIDSLPSPNITSLNTSVSTRFGNQSLEYLIRELFIETSIDNETYFDLFYSQCAPISCSYTIVQRRDLIVVLLLLISIWGGLIRILQILVQAFGKMIFFLIDWWKNRDTQHPSPSTIVHLRNLFNVIHKSIINMNLYKTTSNDEIDLRQQRKQTRIYLVVFITCLSVILGYTAIIDRSITKTRVMPSIADYEHLLDFHSIDLNCPCTRISIPYKEFVTELRVNVFHQACSTNLIEKTLTSGTVMLPGTDFPNSRDFRNFQKVFYSNLQQLCALANQSVNTSIMIFQDSIMFANQVMSRIRFNNEINATLNRFQEKTPIEFIRTLNLIRTTIQGNALIAVFQTNWQLVVAEKGQGRNVSFRSEPVTYVDTQQNSSCSCATSQACTIPAQLFKSNSTPYYIFEGLRLGCYSFETVLQSSISCFYSVACIYNFRQALGISNKRMTSYQKETGGIIELNASLTRFHINDSIETLASEMFIESWTTNLSYERFFNSCAPTYCSYKEYYRFDALELLTTFLSVYVGLSLGIRIMVPFAVRMIKKIRNRCRVVPLQ